jgi:hypothetical protein
MFGQIKVFDNYVPDFVTETITKIVVGSKTLTNETTNANGKLSFFLKIDGTSPGMVSLASPIFDVGAESNNFELRKTIHKLATENILAHPLLAGFKPYRARIYFQFPMAVDHDHKSPHVNMRGPHLVALLYLNDSDGTTAFYNDDESLRMEVEPKKNRLVIFDGCIKHGVGIPKHSPRMVLTYDLIAE